MTFRGMLAVLLFLAVGCGEGMPGDAEFDESEVASNTQGITVNSLAALDWASGWITEVKAQPTRLLENEYTASGTELERMSSGIKATNRNVCGTLVTKLYQKSLGFESTEFYQSFNKAMDGSCEVGTISGVQKGTTSPNASQYRYKIENCGSVGPIKFTRRSTIGEVRSGDVLAVSYSERTDITGHVMIIRATPVIDMTLPAGPSGSTPYAVAIIDSTSSPHGSSKKYPDWRGGNAGQGLGTGTFVVYVNSSGSIVASRWSPTDSTLYRTSTNRIAIGGLR